MCVVKIPKVFIPTKWLSGSALKTGRGEVPGSIPCRACRLSDSELSVVFYETHLNIVWDPLERPTRRAFHLTPTTQSNSNAYNIKKIIFVLKSTI